MSHTPGPWIVGEHRGVWVGPVIRAEGGHKGIAFVVGESDANARLIAAAPGLLAALKVIKDDLLTLDSGDFGHGVKGWRDMDATSVDQLISGSFRVAFDAIAKAEGMGE